MEPNLPSNLVQSSKATSRPRQLLSASVAVSSSHRVVSQNLSYSPLRRQQVAANLVTGVASFSAVRLRTTSRSSRLRVVRAPSTAATTIPTILEY